MPPKRQDRFAVTVLALSTVLLLAVGWVVSGALVAHGAPALAVATGRTAGSFVTLAVITAATGRGRSDARAVLRRPRITAWLAFIGYGVYFGGTMLGVSHIGASRAGLIVALLPCFTFVIGIIGFGERALPRKAAGTAIAVGAAIGYSAVTRSGAGLHVTGLADLTVGIGATVLATVSFAVYSYSYKRHFHDVSPTSALAVLFGAASLMLVVATAGSVSFGTVSVGDWLGSFALGAVLTAPVYITGHELFLRRGPLFVAAIALVVPFLVRVGDWQLGNASAPGLPSMVFMVLCVCGVAAVVR